MFSVWQMQFGKIDTQDSLGNVNFGNSNFGFRQLRMAVWYF